MEIVTGTEGEWVTILREKRQDIGKSTGYVEELFDLEEAYPVRS